MSEDDDLRSRVLVFLDDDAATAAAVRWAALALAIAVLAILVALLS